MQQIGSQVSVGPNETIFHEEDSCDSAYVIEYGTVEVSVIRRGRKIVLGHRGAGEVFGEMAIIDEHRRSATITTLEPCRLIRITREQLHNRINQADPILRMYLGIILERFRATLKGLQAIELGHGSDSTRFGSMQDGLGIASNDYKYAINEIKLEEELNDALHHDDFTLHYQPIIDLRTKRLVGFESLLRWHHAERGLLLPADFLATAEASGLIVPIGAQVFRSACGFLGRLSAIYPTPPGAEELFVSINISARDFTNPRFVDDVVRMTRDAGVSPTQVKLEVTETTLVSHPAAVAEALTQLSDRGYSIAIDDFGTGYSSLSYLHQFPFDTLKIDRGFVKNLSSCEKNDKIVASIANLANHLDLAVVAEGVETRAQERAILDLDCPFAQGYLYARPMPEIAAAAFAANWGNCTTMQLRRLG